MAKIGFIGLGHMGQPMVQNLIAKGHELWVYDVSTAAMEQAVANGAKQATIPELAIDAEIVFTMLQTGEQVTAVCLNKEGIFQYLSTESLYIDCSSIDVVT